MIQHIVMFKFQETACGKTKAENLEEARQRMLALRSRFHKSGGWKCAWPPLALPRGTTTTS